MKVFFASIALLLLTPAYAQNASQDSGQLTAEQKAFHVLNRLAYGPRPEEAEALTASGDAGIEKWINEQLHPEEIPNAGVEAQLKPFSSLSMSIAEIREAFPKPKKEERDSPGFDKSRNPKRILVDLISQKLIRSIESKRQLEEVLVDFWFNHFNVDFSKGQVKWFLTAYERDTIRPRVFGKFRDLLGAVAKSPAMLFYLDNFQSVRDGLARNGKPGKTFGLNENYGRELLELHTLGVDGGYSQKDVRETARAFTGWSIGQPRGDAAFVFRPRAHDTDEKHILNLVLPAGGGFEDGEKVLDMLAKHPATARFIAKKLCVKFISDHPPESAVQKVAAAFQKSDGDLRETYRALFHLPEFWSRAAYRSEIKAPWEFVVSSARALGSSVKIPKRGPLRVVQVLEQSGEPLYRCQPPTGFKATSEFWVNPGALVSRINFGLAIAGDRLPEIDIDRGYFRKRLESEKVEDIGQSIDLLNHWILSGEMRPQTRARLVRELDSEEKVEAESGVTVSLSKQLGLVLGSPDFQRR